MYNVTVKDSTTALYVQGTNDVNKYLRVLFTQKTHTGEVYVPAIKCSDLFAAEIADEDDKFFTEDRFQTGYWVCPDIDQIYLLGQENV